MWKMWTPYSNLEKEVTIWTKKFNSTSGKVKVYTANELSWNPIGIGTTVSTLDFSCYTTVITVLFSVSENLK